MATNARAPLSAWGDDRGLVGGKRVLAALLVAAGIGLGLFIRIDGVRQTGAEEAEQAADSEPAPLETPNVFVAMHLDEPFPADRTIVWTAAFQAAWDALGDAVKKEWGLPTFDLGLPAKPADVMALNGGRLALGTVDPKDLTVIAGRATEETWSKVDTASDRDLPAGTPPPRAVDLVAFARLRASVRYEIPLDVCREPIHFGPSRTPIRGYGLREYATGEKEEKKRAQVALHLRETAREPDLAKEAVVVLTGTDGTRVVVSGRPPKATLGETWLDVADAMSQSPGASFSWLDSLWIPRVSIVTGTSFDALVGAPIVGAPTDSRLAVAREDVMLTADEKGADVHAEAVLVAVLSMSKRVHFDGPFLLAILAKGAKHPYALAWMGSTDGLSLWDAPLGRPLAPVEAERLAGTWSLDREASVDEMVSRRISSIRVVERERIREWIGGIRFDLSLAPDGTASATSGRSSAPQEHPPASLARDGARVVLALKARPSRGTSEKIDPTEHATEQRWFLSRNADRLTLDDPSTSVTLVLRRR